jgi:Ca2+-binding EF-hand superfamily protein
MKRTIRFIVLSLLCGAMGMPQLAIGQDVMRPTGEGDAGRYYVHRLDNEWSLDANVDRSDAGAQFVLTVDTDDGVRIVVFETTITLDGAPYREATERIVDRMLAVAEGHSPVAGDEESVEPTPADTPPGLPASMWRRLERYAETNASSLDRDEARWMVARATGGPALLTLRDGVLPVRLAHSPLWHWLDSDGDGALAVEEIQNAPQRLALLDADRDGSLDRSEWPRRDGDVPAVRLVRTGDTKQAVDSEDPLDIEPLDRGAANEADVASSDDSGHSDLFECDVRSQSDDLAPQLHLIVRLGETDEPRVEVIPVGPTAAADSAEAKVSSTIALSTSHVGETALIEIAGLELYVTVAAGEKAAQGAATTSHQVSVGAAPIGGVIRDAIDTNRDRRLTSRELRDAQRGLAGLDTNDDGRIDAGELPRRCRLLFSVGPTAHALLASDVPLPQSASQSPPEVPAPAWFATMDLNHDGDLSSSEFLGTADVFETIDSDADGLISAAEAARLDAQRSAESE